MATTNERLITRTADLAAAYVAHNHVAASELPTLLTTLHGALCGLGHANAAHRPTPAQIRASIQPDALISFEDGRPYKVLRRHLTEIGITPEAYRAKWGLPADYPLVPQAYSARRSEISKAIGLGGPGRRVQQAAE
ncbi:MucR family transcriptional regulator [Methylobacterium sp. E-066]|uniref:MucR family transcriptional regulator n=1 Tax=Methylobacterium sp. E-066 TaxID=2836584 RepID=UPI001FB9D63D|nr:MucR family transcriptional regulator [Methylobacterium sp. E-066]MCJ2143704.1 MucR family transcriptional regulator [Methylobacterium sp. E-066]